MKPGVLSFYLCCIEGFCLKKLKYSLVRKLCRSKGAPLLGPVPSRVDGGIILISLLFIWWKNGEGMVDTHRMQ